MKKLSWLIAFAFACGPAPLEPKLSVLQEEIFSPSCSNSVCHGGPNPARDLRLDEGAQTHASLVGVSASNGDTYVVAGDPAASLLFQVLQAGVDDIRQMPPGLAIDAELLSVVEEWINSGAADD